MESNQSIGSEKSTHLAEAEKLPPTLPAQLPPPNHYQAQIAQNDDHTMGMLVHLLGILTGIIGVLIIWLVKKDQSRFVDHHGREAMNFHLTVILASFCLVILGLVTFFVGIFLAMPIIMVISIGALVLEIMACIAASKGEWHRYPFTIRFIPDRAS